MADLELIQLPKETVSDDRYIIVAITAKPGIYVEKGEVLLEFQTSKATMELESPVPGYFHTWVEAGQEVAVGATVAVISGSAEVPEDVLGALRAGVQTSAAGEAPSASPGETRFSRAAEELIARHGLSRQLFAGIPLVRREDVERVLQAGQREAPPVQVRKAESMGGKVIILGGGGHAKMCIDVIRSMGVFELAGILDARLQVGTSVLGVPVIGRDSELDRCYAEGFRFAVNGVGASLNHPSRSELFRKIKQAGFIVPNLVHASAIVEPSARLGEGNQIMAGAIVGSDARIGDNCIVNSGAVVSHDSELSNNVHIAPGAVLGGHVKIGDDTLIGMGATIFLGLSIGSKVIVSNGMHVFSNVRDSVVLKH